jgi:hypothetical protein
LTAASGNRRGERMKLGRSMLLAGITVSICVASTMGYRYGLPTLVKSKIESKYPYVRVGRVEFGYPFKTVTLHDVDVTKANAKGHFPLVVVTRADESVDIEGGNFEYTITDHKDPSAGKKHKITAHNLNGTAHKGDYSVEIENLSVDDTQACFWRAHVRHEGAIWGDVADGCVARDLSKVQFKAGLVSQDAVAHFAKDALPHDMLGAVDSRDVEVYPKEMRAHAGEVTYMMTTAKDVSVSYVDPRVNVAVGSVTTEHERAYSGPMTFRGLKTSFDPKKLREEALMVETGGIKLFADPKTLGVAGDEECNDWLDALPAEMHVPAMDGLRFKGRLSFEMQIKPEVKLDLHNKCKAICPVPSVEALKHAFSYTIYDKNNEEGTRLTGPDSPDWVWAKLADISPFMPLAVINLEDPSFRSHHGFVAGAIRNSIKEDVDKDKFARGGSTISMQLAKNVFLKRSKTIGRKVQEALLTIALESCLTKDQIMETYLNVVEFGPDIYGIKAAAESYFSEDASLLDPKQAFYLASILPKPKRAPKPDEKTMARVADLMQVLVNRGSIDPDALTAVEWEKN